MQLTQLIETRQSPKWLAFWTRPLLIFWCSSFGKLLPLYCSSIDAPRPLPTPPTRRIREGWRRSNKARRWWAVRRILPKRTWILKAFSSNGNPIANDDSRIFVAEVGDNQSRNRASAFQTRAPSWCRSTRARWQITAWNTEMRSPESFDPDPFRRPKLC